MGTVKKLIFSKMGLTILHENDTPIEPTAERVTKLKNTVIVEYTNTNKNKVQRKTDMFNIDMIVNNDIVLKDMQHIPVNAQVSVVVNDENMHSLEINKTKTDENRDCNGDLYNLFNRNFIVEEKKDGIIDHEVKAYADVGIIEDDDEDTVEIDLEIEEGLLREIELQEKLKYDLNADNRSNGRKPNFEDWGFEVRGEESIKKDKKLVGNALVNLVRIDDTDAFKSYFKNNTINVRHARLYTGTNDKNLTISMTDKETIIKADSNTAESTVTTYLDDENVTVEAKEIELTDSIKPENTDNSGISDDENIHPTAENTDLTNSQTMNSAQPMIKTDTEEFDPVEQEAIPPVKIRKQCTYKSYDLIPALDGIPETILSNPYNTEALSRISDDVNVNSTTENTDLTNSQTMNSAQPMKKTDVEEFDPVEEEVIPPVKIRKQCIYKCYDLIPELDGIPETILSNPYNMEALSRISDDVNVNSTTENTELTNSQTMNSVKPMIKTDVEELDPVEQEVKPPVKIKIQFIYKHSDLMPELDGIPEKIVCKPYNTQALSRISDVANINPTAENTELANSQTMNSTKLMIKTDVEKFDSVEQEVIPPVKIRKQCIYKSYDLIPDLDGIPETILSNPYNMEALRLIKPVVVRLKESDRLKPRRVVRKVELPHIDEVLRTNKEISTAKVAPIRIRKSSSAWESYTPDVQEYTQGNWTNLSKQIKQIIKKFRIVNTIASGNSRLKHAKHKYKHKRHKQNKRDDKKKKKEKKKYSDIILDPTDELNRQKTNNDMYFTTGNINTSMKETRDASKTIFNSREPNNDCCENYQKKRCEKRKMSDVIEWEKHKRNLQEHFNASDVHKSSTKAKDRRNICKVESGVNKKDMNVFECRTKYRKRKLKNIRIDSDPIKEWETQKTKIKSLAAVSTSNVQTLPTEKQSDSSIPTKEEKHIRDHLEEWEAQKKYFGMDDLNDTSNEQICPVDPGNSLKELTPCDAKQSNNRTEKKTRKDKEREKPENQKEQEAKKNSAINPLEEWESEKNKYKKYFTIGDFGKSEPKKLPKTANKINEPCITELKLIQVGSQTDAEKRYNMTFNTGDVNSGTSKPTKSHKNELNLVQDSSQICFQNGNVTYSIEDVSRASKTLRQDKTELKMVQAESQIDAEKAIQATSNVSDVNKTVRQDKTELELVQEGRQIDAEKRINTVNIGVVNSTSNAIQDKFKMNMVQEKCQIDSEKVNKNFNIYDINRTSEAVRQDKTELKLVQEGRQIVAEKRINTPFNIGDVNSTSKVIQDKFKLNMVQEKCQIDSEKVNKNFNIYDVNRTSEAVRQDKTELKLVQEGRQIDVEKRINTPFNIGDVNSTSKAIQDKFKMNMVQEKCPIDSGKGNMTINIGDVRVNRTCPPTHIGTGRWSKLQASPSVGRDPRLTVGRYNCNQPNRTFVKEQRRLITPDPIYLKTNTSVSQNYHKESTNTIQKPKPSQILFHPKGVGRDGNEIDLLIDEMNRKISGLCGSRERHHIFDPFLKNVAGLDANGGAYVTPLESIKDESILQRNKMLVSMLERKQPVLELPQKPVDMSFQKKNQILPSFKPNVNEMGSSSKQHVLEAPEQPLDLTKGPDKSLEKLKTLQSLLAHENSKLSSAGAGEPSTHQTKQSTLESSKPTPYPEDSALEKLQTLRSLLLADTNVKKLVRQEKTVPRGTNRL